MLVLAVEEKGVERDNKKKPSAERGLVFTGSFVGGFLSSSSFYFLLHVLVWDYIELGGRNLERDKKRGESLLKGMHENVVGEHGVERRSRGNNEKLGF